MFIDATPGRSCIVDGKEYLFFSGYAYLGMNHVEGFIKNIQEGINKYGIVFPSSRNSNTKFSLYGEMEEALSGLTTMEDSVIFSSGYLAGQTISNLLKHHKNILVAPGTHPSICITEHQGVETNFSEWTDRVNLFIQNSNERECVLVSDSINILEGVVNNFAFLKTLTGDIKITFLIDDSHGIGILGENGNGISSMLPKQPNVEYIISYSLSKAFNIEGGAVSASSQWCNLLRQHPNYTGSTSISPGMVYAFLESTKIYNSQRHLLFGNIQRFMNSISFSQKKQPLPIFICGNENSANIFLENGIIISSFSYPFPGSRLANRIIINALHSEADIQQLSAIWHQLQ